MLEGLNINIGNTQKKLVDYFRARLGFAMYLKFFILITHHVHDLLQSEAELELDGVRLVYL